MRTLGPYVLKELLGRGGLGEVWATDRPEVAVKCVADTAGEGWADPLAEVRAIAALDHPHILRALDFGRADGWVWIAMERAETSLVDAMPATFTEIRAVLGSVLGALAHAHARGIVHLDVKADNLLWLDGRWVLADFGLAHLVGVLRAGDDRPRGTPAYMAPEQFTGSAARYGPPTDLYAVGCLATLLVSGRPPFDVPSVAALAQAHRFHDPPPLEPLVAVPDGFDAWRLRLLEKDPGDRFPLAHDALMALDGLGEVGAEGAPAPRYSADTFVLDGPDPLPEARRPLPGSRRDPLVDDQTFRRRLVADPCLLDLRALPLVGRQTELARLHEHLRAVRHDGGQRRVALAGEPGIGRHHLARAFAWGANEAGLALLPDQARDSRPLVVVDPEGPVDGPALIVRIDTGGPADDTVTLGPLSDAEAQTLARTLAPLDESLVARLAATSRGHPGTLIGTLRRWHARGRLVPETFGLTLAPAADPAEDAPPADALEEPLRSLAWSAEEDPDGALDLLRAHMGAVKAEGRPATALWWVDIADRALRRATRPDPELALDVALLRAGTLNAMGHLHPARATARVATRIAEELGDPARLCDALLQEVHLSRFLGEDPVPILDRVEAVAPDVATRARALAIRGSHAIVHGDLEPAREHLHRAVALMDAHGVTTFLGTALLWLGNAYLYDGLVEAAEPIHRRCLATFEARGHAAGAAQALRILSESAMIRGDHDEARALTDALRQRTQQLGSPWLAAALATTEAWLHEREGRLHEAEQGYREALARVSETEIPKTGIHQMLARVLVRLGRTGEAEVHLQAAMPRRPTEHLELDLLRLASLPSDDPRWSEVLDRCATEALTIDTRHVLEALAARSEPELRARIEAVLHLR